MALPPQIAERLAVLGVDPSEVSERFVRGTGPGGQKINKTSSTVWLRHGPTGIEVRCQAGRSQAANREAAWTELCRKIEEQRWKASDRARQEFEAERRRRRGKTRSQKALMVESKRHRRRTKERRGRISDY
jgi:protein subunit release factor B